MRMKVQRSTGQQELQTLQEQRTADKQLSVIFLGAMLLKEVKLKSAFFSPGKDFTFLLNAKQLCPLN